ncbi:MAG TPA: S53 family peptidase [Candidatus Limnocylindrales bacterium]
MKTTRFLTVLASAALIIGLVPAAAVASSGSAVSPSLIIGPKAIPAGVTSPADYSLFSCQLGLSVGACYDPYQMRHAYGIDSLISAGYTGKGKTIIIVDAFQSPNIAAQLNYFDTFYGLPGLNGLGNPYDPTLGRFTQIAPDGLTPFDATNDGMVGWAEEISLDVLWAHAIAPGANIVLDLSKSDQDPDILSATKYAVRHNLGDVISQSFGENESCVDKAVLTGEHQVFAEATRKGMTIFASSGDEGAAQLTCDGNSWAKAASSPASDPLVTGVGGTELVAAPYCLTSLGCDPTTNPAAGTYQSEVAWNEGPTFGDFQDEFDSTLASGGGFSVLYRQPAFQASAVRSKQRGVADVSYSGSVMHGVLTYLDIPGIPAGFYRFGGTSAGSPQWAAIIAIADQKARGDLGFINAALYRMGPAFLHDITSGNNSAMELDVDGNPVTINGFNSGRGWDAPTGLGTPAGTKTVNRLIQVASRSDGPGAIAGSDAYQFGNWFGRGYNRPH